jgi:cytochrome c biogenesis protein CcmG/thiol:disulfide interchange protein DsbE
VRNRSVLLGFAVCAAIVAAAAVLRPRPKPSGDGRDPPPAPAFALPAADGRTISLESLRGRVVALNFWATWCAPCKAEIPELAAVYAAHRGQCLELLGVAEESGDRAEVREVAKELGVNYPIVFDEDGKVGEAFKIPGYPWTFLVDASGRIRKTFRGSLTRDELEAALAPLLAEVAAGCPALARGMVDGAAPR